MAQLCSRVHGNSSDDECRFPRQTLLLARTHHMFTISIFMRSHPFKHLKRQWVDTLISVAFVPVRLTHPSWSVRFHSTLAVGISGDPSYRTTEAPTANADTSQFHIIQPVCGQKNPEVSGFLSSTQVKLAEKLRQQSCKLDNKLPV